MDANGIKMLNGTAVLVTDDVVEVVGLVDLVIVDCVVVVVVGGGPNGLSSAT